MSITDILEFFKVYGPAGLLLGYFVWQDYNAKKYQSDRDAKDADVRKKERDDLVERVRALEDYEKDVLQKLAMEANNALVKMNELCNNNNQLVSELLATIRLYEQRK